MIGSGQTRSFGFVGSMSGLPESGHGWAIYEYMPQPWSLVGYFPSPKNAPLGFPWAAEVRISWGYGAQAKHGPS